MAEQPPYLYVEDRVVDLFGINKGDLILEMD